MPIINKTKRTAAIYNRGREVVKVYDHGTLAWQKSIPDYLCFTALEAGQFTLTIPAAVTSDNLTYVEYSLDGRNWTRLTVDDTAQSITTPTIQTGGKVYWRGSGIQYMTSDSRTNDYFNKTSYFSSSNRFDASGNIMSMLYAEDFEGKTAFPGTSNQYFNIGAMFQHCEYLVHAADLLLPATTLKHLCYTGMFYYCGSLLDAPSLPATVISNANYCYRYMFQGCSSLITPPDLSHVTTTARSGLYAMFFGCSSLTTATLPQASHLMKYCYYNMYRGCTSITSADLSSARTIDTHACENMFYGCSSLAYVKCLATDISATDCLTNWLSGVSSTGTFIQASGVTWPRGASGIPTGWLAYDEGEQIPNDYTPCDYIYNTSSSQGSEDLGFVFGTRSYSLETKFKQDEISNAMVCGSSTGDGRIWIYNYANVNKFAISILPAGASQVIIYPFQPVDTDVHIIKYIGDGDDQYYYHNGTIVGHGTRTDFTDTCPSNLYIFGRPANQYKGRIYYLKVWNTATEDFICNLIPCSRNSDGAAGFWDTAQKQFFTSTYWTAHFDNE